MPTIKADSPLIAGATCVLLMAAACRLREQLAAPQPQSRIAAGLDRSATADSATETTRSASTRIGATPVPVEQARRFEISVGVSYALLVAALAVPVFALLHAFEAAEARDHVVAEATDTVTRVVRIQAELGQIAADGRAYLLTGNASLVSPEALAALRDDVAALRGDITGAAGEQLLRSIDGAIVEYAAASRRVFEARAASAGAPSPSTVALFETEMLPRQRSIADELGAYIVLRQQAVEPATVAAETEFNRALVLSFTTLVLALLASAALGLYSARRLVRLHAAEQAALQRATEAIAARDVLMGIVAHDLRSPLAAVSLKAGIIRRTADATLARHAHSIETIALRMELLIRTLLDTALIQEGRFSVSPIVTSVPALVDAARDTFAAQAAAKSIALCVEAADEELWVRADPPRIAEVLGNILDNAIKFTPAGGSITIVVAPADGMVRFSVTDTGIGIAPADLPHVFDRFWRTRSPGARGTGLGLHIAREIILGHGGQIWVESEPGRGSTFSFTLHRAAPART